MIQAYKSIIVFSLYIVTLCGCSNKSSSNINESIKNDFLIVDNKYYYHKIDSFVNLFDVSDSYKYFHKDKSYPIDDSLSFYFSKLNIKELVNDDEFKYMGGKLLEKLYLGERSLTEKPESFPIYNMMLLTLGPRISQRFALNIIFQNEMAVDSDFENYASAWTEFVCIDSVVLILDKLPQMQNDPNHQKCMYLVTNNKTGGCKW